MKRRRLPNVVEVLESRLMLALSAAGGEFQVNTYTPLAQGAPAIAGDGDGDFVVVWQSDGQDGSGNGIYGRRYNSSGVAQGAEFRVNTYTTGAQTFPAVAMDGDGDFVVVWDSAGQDGNSNGIFAQRYNAAGVAQGQEFQVNTFTSSQQVAAAVAMDVAGNFVISWSSRDQDANLLGVYARRYDFEGVAAGTEFRVNSYTLGDQTNPSVAMNASGAFIVSWQSFGVDGASTGIAAQRYDVAGAKQGSEFLINTYTTGQQDFPAVAMNASGEFVVAWQSESQDGSVWGIYGQRFNSAGTPQGSEFQVNIFTTFGQQVPMVAMDLTGNFTIVWSSGYGQDGSAYGAYARRYNAAGTPLTSEFLINTYTTNSQSGPVIAMTPTGDHVIAWGSGQDGSSASVHAQRYDESTDLAGPMAAGMFINGRQVAPYGIYDVPVTQIVVSFSEGVTDAGGSAGVNSVTNPANWLLTRGLTDVTPNINSISYGFNPLAFRYEATFNFTTPYTSGNLSLKARDNLRDVSGNQLDGNLDAAPGAPWVMPFSLGGFGPQGSEIQVVSSTTALDPKDPKVAMDAEGNYVVVWQSYDTVAHDSVIRAQRYNAAGVPQGLTFQVNTFTAGTQTSPDVAMSSSGHFVVVWDSSTQDSGTWGVYARRYDAAGVAQGTEFRVNSFISSDQREPSIAMTPSGHFVVAYSSLQDIGATYGVFVMRFDAAGNALASQASAHTYTTGNQRLADVAIDWAGNFVVTWRSDGQDGSGYGVYGQRFSAAGVQQGSEFRINTTTTGSQLDPSVAMDADGDFVVAWTGPNSVVFPYTSAAFMQRYRASGSPDGGEVKITTFTTRTEAAPDVAMSSNGEYVVTWSRSDQTFGVDPDIYVQRFGSNGSARGTPVLVNTYTTGSQGSSAVGLTANGDIVVTWDDQSRGIYAQRLLWDRPPTVGVLTDSPDPVVRGNSITLLASSVTDNGLLSHVSFYRESNGIAGLQVGPEGDTYLNVDFSPGGGFWTSGESTSGLPLGTYTYWAQATDNGGLTGAPASTTSTVSLSVVAANFVYDTAPQKLTFTFDGDASGLIGVSSIQLEKVGGGAVPALTMLPYGTDGSNVASFTMNTLLADGNYKAMVTGIGGSNMLDFFILSGDANHDRRVDLKDLVILANNWQGSSKTFSQGNFDYSGLVDAADLGKLALNWQQSLAAPVPALPAVPTLARPSTRTPSRTPTRVLDLVQ